MYQVIEADDGSQQPQRLEIRKNVKEMEE